MLFEGDCIQLMKNMPDNSVGLCFADPPYNAKNIGPDRRTYSLGQMQLPLPEYKKFCQDWFGEARRISERLLLTPGIANMTYYPQPDWAIAWHKPAAVSFNRFGGFNVWEPIYLYGRIPKGNRLSRDLLEVSTHNGFGKGTGIESKHPCPKPLELMRTLVSIFSVEGETVFDPFAGSGTTLRAAKDLGRQYIGIDINPEYIAICNKRLAQEVLL
jgi:site-specific DNA-methyltransferase (adenine-specific)